MQRYQPQQNRSVRQSWHGGSQRTRRSIEKNGGKVLAFTGVAGNQYHYQKINDALGHQQGDDCLRAVASTASRELREDDILARYGGDEFIALSPRTEAEAALKIGQRLVDTMKIECSYKTTDERVTISMGIASCPKDVQNLETLIIHADRALYDAKNAGRARAVLYKQTD